MDNGRGASSHTDSQENISQEQYICLSFGQGFGH